MSKLEAGVLVADRFRLERELGRGGMGCVWQAHHTSLDVPCAVKFIVGEAGILDEAGRARFASEARVAAKLRSPNVVQILDHGIWEDTPYIAMELLEGESLSERLARLGRITPTAIAAIVADVALALTRAEELKIVHRDLKPDNIFIVKHGDHEIAKVLDFGVAKFVVGEQPASVKTQTGAFMGTPPYMSPEQAHGAKEVDHRSDLWSLGVITFECLTGKLPFTQAGLGELFGAIMLGPLPVPSEIEPSVPPLFDDWWARAAERDVDARFQSARELSDALDMVVEGTSGDDEAPSFRARRARVPSGAAVHDALAETRQGDLPSARDSERPALAAQTFSGHERPREAERSRRRLLAVGAGIILIGAGGFYALRGRVAPSVGVDPGAATNGVTADQTPTPEPVLPASGAAPASASIVASAAPPEPSSHPSAAQVGSKRPAASGRPAKSTTILPGY